MYAVLQEWIEIEGFSTVEVLQSSAGWLSLDDYQDVTFFLEVRVKRNAELALDYDTAPSLDPSLFKSMAQVVMSESSTPLMTKVLLSQNPTLPLAGLVRWRITSMTPQTPPDPPWRVNFRITCVAKGAR